MQVPAERFDAVGQGGCALSTLPARNLCPPASAKRPPFWSFGAVGGVYSLMVICGVLRNAARSVTRTSAGQIGEQRRVENVHGGGFSCDGSRHYDASPRSDRHCPVITGEVGSQYVAAVFTDLAEPERHCKTLVLPNT